MLRGRIPITGKGHRWSIKSCIGLLILVFVLPGMSGCSTAAKIKKENMGKAHYTLGISNLNEKHVQLAFIEFQKAIEINSKDKQAHYAIGHIFYTRGKYTDAIKYFKKAVRIDSNFSDAHNYLGMVYERQKNHELAIREFKKALQNIQYRTPEKAHYNIGRNLVELGRSDEAIEEFLNAVNISPEYTPGFMFLGKTYLKKGQMEEAEKAFNTVLKNVPNLVEAHFLLAEVYLKRGSENLAREHFNKVIQIAPDSEMARSSEQQIKSLR